MQGALTSKPCLSTPTTSFRIPSQSKTPLQLRNATQHFYNDVNKLSMAELNNLCKKHGINTNYPLCATVWTFLPLGLGPLMFLCHVHQTRYPLTLLQLQTIQTFTPNVMYGLSEWTKDLTLVPDLSDYSIKSSFCKQMKFPATVRERTRSLDCSS
jgi:hypothetical protein